MKTVVALYDFIAENSEELSFNSGDYIEITGISQDGWVEGMINGKIGLIPQAYVQECERPPTPPPLPLSFSKKLSSPSPPLDSLPVPQAPTPPPMLQEIFIPAPPSSPPIESIETSLIYSCATSPVDTLEFDHDITIPAYRPPEPKNIFSSEIENPMVHVEITNHASWKSENFYNVEIIGHVNKKYTEYHIHERNGNTVVRRRYKNFEWLYNCLLKIEFLCVPVLPDKVVNGRLDEEFVKRRQESLNRWLKMLNSHPFIRTTNAFRIFVTERELPKSTEEVLNVEVKPLKPLQENFSFAKNQFVYFKEVLGGFSFSSLLNSFHKISVALRKSKHECWRDGCDECKKINKNLDKTSDVFYKLSKLSHNNVGIVDRVCDLDVYANSVSSHTFQVKSLEKLRNLRKKNQNLNPGEFEKLSRELSSLNALGLAEFDFFHKTKNEELKGVVCDLLDGQIDFYKKCIDGLEEARTLFD